MSGQSDVWKLSKDVIAGTCGGIAVTLIGHPFDTLKVRLQSQSAVKPVYSGVVDCFKKTLQWEGPAGLYKGVASPLVGQMFFRSALFSTFGASKRYFSQNSDGTTRVLKPSDFYKCGAITGFVAAFFEGPIDFYKSQVQVQIIRAKSDPNYKPPFTSMAQCVRQSIQKNGVRGPFQSLGATILRNTPANSIYLGSFEVLKRYAATEVYHCEQTELPAHIVMGAAGFGGLLYWCAIFPIDCVKSAMATDAIDPKLRKYPNMAAAARDLYAQGGIKRFYTGFTPCLLRAVPANACMLYTVDKVLATLNKL